MFLRCSIQDNPKHWKRWLPLAEFWYNSTFHTTLGSSPFKALYGHEPNFGAKPDNTVELASPVADMLLERAAQLELLKTHLAAAQNRMKLKVDRNRTEKEFRTAQTPTICSEVCYQSPIPQVGLQVLWAL